MRLARSACTRKLAPQRGARLHEAAWYAAATKPHHLADAPAALDLQLSEE